MLFAILAVYVLIGTVLGTIVLRKVADDEEEAEVFTGLAVAVGMLWPITIPVILIVTLPDIIHVFRGRR